MAEILFNKFRAAAEVLHRGRELLVESMAEDVLDQGNDLLDNGYLFNEFLEAQGTGFISYHGSLATRTVRRFIRRAGRGDAPAFPNLSRRSTTQKEENASEKATAEGLGRIVQAMRSESFERDLGRYESSRWSVKQG